MCSCAHPQKASKSKFLQIKDKIRKKNLHSDSVMIFAKGQGCSSLHLYKELETTFLFMQIVQQLPSIRKSPLATSKRCSTERTCQCHHVLHTHGASGDKCFKIQKRPYQIKIKKCYIYTVIETKYFQYMISMKWSY